MLTRKQPMQNTSSDHLRAIAHRWIEEGWQKGDAGVVDELHDVNFVDHSPSGRTPNCEGFKQGIRELYAAFPDFHGIVGDRVVDAATGKVAIRWSATATHRGEFMGVTPTGRSITFRGIEIIRIENGCIVERWGEWDGIDVLQQLGTRMD